MSTQYTNESVLDMFIFETSQLMTDLEQMILENEKENGLTINSIHEIFRVMHTIKGGAGMMMFTNIASLAHAMEDIFYYLREEMPQFVNFLTISDLLLESIDFIKGELEKIKNGEEANGDASGLIETLKTFLHSLKEKNQTQRPDLSAADVAKKVYKVVIHFEDGCEMENIRAYTIVHRVKGITDTFSYVPEDLINNEDSSQVIRQEGFQIFLESDWSYEKLQEFFNETIFLKRLELTELESDDLIQKEAKYTKKQGKEKLAEGMAIVNENNKSHRHTSSQNMISVHVDKLDKLMDLVGEMVIAESMVLQNPDLKGLQLENFQKSARHLSKITKEIQDMVMSVRMVPLTTTFLKMQRIVRDMCKKLDKEVSLEIIGDETEVDKNIIEHISDPLMHLVRNALDHGIETKDERLAKGKKGPGTLILEAKNTGNDVQIIVRDDGRGLDKDTIYQKAVEHGMIARPKEEMTDKEIFNLILLPGFSTKESVSEFSGRGVGMDVVAKNIETLGGLIAIDSVFGKGTTFTLKLPLTLAIIDGMTIKVGPSFYTLPTLAIKESFRPEAKDIITDLDGNEMIMVRGNCYPILRLHKIYKTEGAITHFNEGIIIMIEHDEKTLCLFADELLGQHQVVVKALPKYIRELRRVKGISGCTLLGDGSISLILDIAAFMQ